MKNRFFLLLPGMAILMFLGSCSGENNDLDKSGLNGPVRGFTELWFEAVRQDGTWKAGEPSSFGNRIMNYDREGYNTGSVILTSSGDTIGVIKCRRENGKLVEEVFQSHMDSRSVRTLFEKVEENQENFEAWEGERLLYEGATFLDSKGRPERQVQVVNDREVTNYYIYEKDMLVEFYQEDFNGQRTITQLYEETSSDEKGNWTKRLVYAGDEKIVPDFLVIREYTYY